MLQNIKYIAVLLPFLLILVFFYFREKRIVREFTKQIVDITAGKKFYLDLSKSFENDLDKFDKLLKEAQSDQTDKYNECVALRAQLECSNAHLKTQLSINAQLKKIIRMRDTDQEAVLLAYKEIQRLEGNAPPEAPVATLEAPSNGS